MINFNSITYKFIALLLGATLIILITISSVAYSLTKSAYSAMEEEKTNAIMADNTQALALNISYDFVQAVDDIAKEILKNKRVLYLRIHENGSKNEHVFSQDKSSYKKLLGDGNFHKQIELFDPISQEKIGEFELIYSNSYFLEEMHHMQKIAFIVIAIFLGLILYIVFYMYHSIKPLTYLATAMREFNILEPKHLECTSSSNSEIEQIAHAANVMIDKIIEHSASLEELNSTLAMREVHLKDAQRMAHLGSWEYFVSTSDFEMSTEMRRILGIKKELKSCTFDSFLNYISASDVEYFISVINTAIEKGSLFKIRHKMVTSKGKNIEMMTQGKVRKKADGSIRVTAVSMDISEQAASQHMIEKLAYYDPLTSLPNRSLFKDRLNKAILQAQRYENKLCVMFLDLDHFKLINDTLGHSVGDELLKSVALRLSSVLRAIDTISRVGGDEFVILLPIVNSREDAEEVAKKIIRAMKESWLIHSHQLYVTTSVGISIFPDDSSDMETLIAHADTAMYSSKENGRDNYSFFEKNMQNKLATQLELERDLRIAVEKEDELVLYYQPKIDLESNRVASVEALIRWQHPKDGLIYPDTFIPLAESTGIIIEIGKFVITEAIKQIAIWQKLDADVQNIAVNLSGRQFQSKDLIPFIRATIDEYGIKPTFLEFEITESISMANIQESLRIMYELKALGVSVSIDDFGTGYSSLSYLKQFSVDTLKVDKSFVLDMIDDDEDKILVQTIITLAHSLGIKVIAEGVESKEHAKMLREMNCDYAQGFYYAKALRVDDLTEYLDGYNLI